MPYTILFAASVSAYTYKKMGRRLGYGNTKSVFTVVAITFVFAAIVFYTFVAWVLHLN